jgi:hypothetical protein
MALGIVGTVLGAPFRALDRLIMLWFQLFGFFAKVVFGLLILIVLGIMGQGLFRSAGDNAKSALREDAGVVLNTNSGGEGPGRTTHIQTHLGVYTVYGDFPVKVGGHVVLKNPGKGAAELLCDEQLASCKRILMHQ